MPSGWIQSESCTRSCSDSNCAGTRIRRNGYNVSSCLNTEASVRRCAIPGFGAGRPNNRTCYGVPTGRRFARAIGISECDKRTCFSKTQPKYVFLRRPEGFVIEICDLIAARFGLLCFGLYSNSEPGPVFGGHVSMPPFSTGLYVFRI